MNLKARLSNLAPFLVIMAGASWGIIGIFSKRLTTEGFSPVQIVFVRVGIAAVLIWLYLIIFDIQKLRIQIKDIWMFLGTGVFSLVFFSTLYFTTLRLTSLSVAAVLLYTAPCFVMIMSAIFFGEKITSKKTVALILAFAGCLCTSGLFEVILNGSGIGSIPILGILTGVGSGIGYALYSIFGKVALKKYDTVTVTAYTFISAFLALLPFCAGNELFVLLQSGDAIKNTIEIGIISTLIPYLLYTQGLRYTEPGKASILAFSEPFVATLTGIIVFRERITIGGAAGILLIFFSIVILNAKERKCKNESKAQAS